MIDVDDCVRWETFFTWLDRQFSWNPSRTVNILSFSLTRGVKEVVRIHLTVRIKYSCVTVGIHFRFKSIVQTEMNLFRWIYAFCLFLLPCVGLSYTFNSPNKTGALKTTAILIFWEFLGPVCDVMWCDVMWWWSVNQHYLNISTAVTCRAEKWQTSHPCGSVQAELFVFPHRQPYFWHFTLRFKNGWVAFNFMHSTQETMSTAEIKPQITGSSYELLSQETSDWQELLRVASFRECFYWYRNSTPEFRCCQQTFLTVTWRKRVVTLGPN